MSQANSSPSPLKRPSGSVAKAGVNLLKKLVYDNYEAPATERRAIDRDEAVGEVLVKIVAGSGQPEVEFRAFVRDTSRGGCGLWCRQAIPIGATVMVSGAAGKTKDMPQRIARVRPCRGASATGFAVGVQFNADNA